MHTNRAAESDDVVFEALSFLPRDLIDDLYFVSKCFQRTIAHHENLLPRRRVESVVLVSRVCKHAGPDKMWPCASRKVENS